jgi:uncharacterized membrane protein
MTFYDILNFALLLAIPYVLLRWRQKRLIRLVGPIGMAYFLGLAVSLLIFALQNAGLTVQLDTSIGESLSFVAIAVAIPLLLFSANLGEAKKLSKMVLASFFSLILAVSIASAVGFVLIGRNMAYGAELSGMAVGLYTGGTPNFNAIANIFGLDVTTRGIANLADIITGGVFYFFILLAAKPLLSKVLKPSQTSRYVVAGASQINVDELEPQEFRFTKALVRNVLLALLIAVLSAGIGILIWILGGATQGRMNDSLIPSLMIGGTILGIAGSFIRKVRNTSGTNVVGHYLILLFSYALASSLDLTRIEGNLGGTMWLLGFITVLGFSLHALFSKWLNVDVDCAIVTMTAGIYSPAFVPAITAQLKNDALTIPGLILGSIGYAVGTFLGYLLGLLYTTI